MAKRYKKLECGDYVRECLYSCPEPQDKPIARAEKSKATSKAQERVNQNNAKIKRGCENFMICSAQQG